MPNLLKGRPAVTVFVGAPAGWNEAREAQGLAVGYPVEAAALIDTGAARTLIAASLVNRLGLPVLVQVQATFFLFDALLLADSACLRCSCWSQP